MNEDGRFSAGRAELGFERSCGNDPTRLAYRPFLSLTDKDGRLCAMIHGDEDADTPSGMKKAALALLDSVADDITEIATEVMEMDEGDAPFGDSDFESIARTLSRGLYARFITLELPLDKAGSVVKAWPSRPEWTGASWVSGWMNPLYVIVVPNYHVGLSDRFRNADGKLDYSLCIIDMEDEMPQEER